MKVNLKRVASIDRSKGVIADIKKDDMANGTGVRVTVFVGYCPLNCYNCFNRKIQSYNWGLKKALTNKDSNMFPQFYSQNVEDDIITALKPSYVSGLTMLGGEPFLNVKTLLSLCKRVRKEFGNSKTIWSWSGFEWEELQQMIDLPFPLSKSQKEMLSLIDVLVDGRYIDSIRKLDKTRNEHDIHFRGSSNQRIINVPESLSKNKLIEHTEIYEEEKIVNRTVDFKLLTGKENIKELIKMGL